MKNVIKTSMILLFTLLINNLSAQTETDSLPGNPDLPSSKMELAELAALDTGSYKYSVEDYFKKPDQSAFNLSPNGKYLSYMQKSKDGKNHVYIKNTETGEATLAIEEKEQLIATYLWGNEDILLYAMDKGGDENYHLYSYNIETKKDFDLTPFEGARIGGVNNISEKPEFIIVSLNKRNKEIFEPYKVNIKTGDIELVFENTDSENPIVGYDYSRDGNLRAIKRQKNGVDYVLYYKNVGEDEFKEVLTTNWKQTFDILDFKDDTSDLAYVKTNLESDTDEIVLYDLKKKKLLKDCSATLIMIWADFHFQRKETMNWMVMIMKGKSKRLCQLAIMPKIFIKKLRMNLRVCNTIFQVQRMMRIYIYSM